MKVIKNIVFCILIVIGFLFTSELEVYFLDNFQESYYRSSFAFVDVSMKMKNSEIVNDFLETARRNKVDFFIVESKICSDYKKDIIIYGTDGAIDALNKKNIKQKKYSSLIIGETQVIYQNFFNVNNIRSFKDWYFIGGEEQLHNMRSFKAELVDKYGGGFPQIYGSDKETKVNLVFVWGVLFCLTLLFSLYEVACEKKENVVKVIMGMDLKYIVLKNILVDSVCFSIAFFLIKLILLNFSNELFLGRYVYLCFSIFLLLNAIIHLFALHINLKKDFANTSGSPSLLIIHYSLKVVSLVVVIVLLTCNAAILCEGYNYYLQRDYFNEHKQYCYYQLNYGVDNELGKDSGDSCEVQQMFYQMFQERSLEYIDLTGNLETKYPILLINKASKEEIIRTNPELKEMLTTLNQSKLYILLPSNISDNHEELEKVKQIYNFYFRDEFKTNNQTEIYAQNINLVMISNYIHTYRSKLVKNPIILLNNTEQVIDRESALVQNYYAYDIMYDITVKELENFVEKHQLQDGIVKKTNVLDVYHYNWNVIKRSIKLLLILTVFLVMLEMFLIIFILKMEYTINSMEFAIKKVLGYSLFERYKKIMIITIGTTGFSMLGSYIVSVILNIQGGIFLIISGIFLLVVELLFIYLKSNSIERLSISTILKGERV